MGLFEKKPEEETKPSRKGDYAWGRGKMQHYTILSDGTIQFHEDASPGVLAKIKRLEVRKHSR
jgi:hypothetical protein